MENRLNAAMRAIALAVVFSFAFFFAACVFAADTDTPVYRDPSAPVDARVRDLLSRMTLDEKIDMVGGDPATGFDTRPNKRLGIPKLSMADGPHGVRWGEATSFPPGVSTASTWNPELARLMGEAMAREALAKGRNVLLGPCINIHRNPFGGRNFESFSEDPFLAGRLAAAYVLGVQAQHVVATPKHYAVNNQEYERNTISVEIGERALREIYLPHFETAVREGGALAVMCSYNRINGVYACEHPHILTDILKKEWGFTGIVMSDWGAVHSTVGTALSGMDLEMPNSFWLGKPLMAAVKSGKVPESMIDDMAGRVLRVIFESGIFDGKGAADSSWVDSPAHRALALDLAREAIILLKNDRAMLPFDRSKIRTIAVIGPNAAEARTGGGGSSWVSPSYKVSPLEGILKQAGGIEVRYAKGCELQMPVDTSPIPPRYLAPPNAAPGDSGLLAEYFDNLNHAGEPKTTRVEKYIDYNADTSESVPGVDRNRFSARWTAVLTPPVSGKYTFSLVSDGIAALMIDGKTKVNNMAIDGMAGKSGVVTLEAGKQYKLRVKYNGAGRAMVRLGWTPPGVDPLADAARLAAGSDAAVVVVGLDNRIEGEGNDRENIELPGRQNDLIEAVAAANPNTVVVLFNGTPLIMEKWIDKVPAVVEAWYPGQEGGRALAEILFGDVNPSGKLTITLPRSWEQHHAFGDYPGADGKVNYADGIFVGYRYYDTKGVEPRFPFGHGLSYTSFEYSGLKISPDKMGAGDDTVEVSLDVANTGPRAGAEVVQLYVRDLKSSVERPVRELKGFEKVELAPGETKRVTFRVDRRALSFYDEKKKKWTAEPGGFEIEVGASSRDIRLRGALTLER